MAPRVLLVGIGGPTCSGKTTLTKTLLSLLPPPRISSQSTVSASPTTATTARPASPPRHFILHQDDFAPPEKSLIWNERVGSADWDDPDTSVDWQRMRQTTSHIKDHATLPEGHSSHDELNTLPSLPLNDTTLLDRYRDQFARALPDDLVVVFADGFLLYYDAEVASKIDAAMFLRIDKALLRQRRESRGGYVTAEGETWKDPPLYFDEILWPSHLKAHSQLFEGGDVEHGKPAPRAKGVDSSSPPITVIEAQDREGKARQLDEMIDESCQVLLKALQDAKFATPL